jgi:hypothetical protein
MLLHLGHLPDPDNAFKFYGFVRVLDVRHYKFEYVLQEIETLNLHTGMGSLRSWQSRIKVEPAIFIPKQLAYPEWPALLDC